MKILWMKPILPYPPTQGTKRVTLQLLEHLSQDHEIVLFARLLGRDEERFAQELEERLPRVRVAARLTPNRRSWFHRLLYFVFTRWRGLRGIPPIESYVAPPLLVKEFHELCAAENPDLVVAEYWYSQEYLRGLTKPAILFTHDMEFDVRQRAGSLSRERGRGGSWGSLEVAREMEALRSPAFKWMLTPYDQELAIENGCSRSLTRVVPYGLDLTGELRPRQEDDPQSRVHSVLLFGAFQADFNRDALRFTLEEVWPRVLKLVPQAVLRVCGSGLPEISSHVPGVVFEGEVRSVRKALLSAEVILIPLRYGGGLRIRLLEALALECAVVGTPTGVLGMGPQADRDVLVGETAEELAGQVARALEDPDLRAELGRHGRRTVVRDHDLGAVAQAQRDLVESYLND